MIREIPKKFQELYDKRTKSRKAAVRSFCLECCGYDADEVRKCTDKDCPLYLYRIKG